MQASRAHREFYLDDTARRYRNMHVVAVCYQVCRCYRNTDTTPVRHIIRREQAIFVHRSLDAARYGFCQLRPAANHLLGFQNVNVNLDTINTVRLVRQPQT